MSHQITKVDLIPNGELSVCNVSQFDNGRVLPFEILENKEAYNIPNDIRVELHCRKADGNIVTLPSENITDNIVTFLSTTQLTACYGKNVCEIALYGPDDYLIGSGNFILDVEKSPTLGGINSTSEIHNLEEQIEEIATEIIGEDYYNKSEVDGLLADKANAADVYTKSQVDSALALKANAADVYTKSQVDSALALKANAADVYTKQEVDNIIMDIMPVDTASGAIATFDTELDAPLVNVSCNIVATGGNGTPDNPNPINGYTEANITANGNTYTIAFGQTVYGGVLDVTSGKLRITHGFNNKLDKFNWSQSAQGFYNASLSGLKFVTSGSQLPNIKCSTLKTVTPSTVYTLGEDKVISTATGGPYIWAYDSDYSDAVSFAASLSGVQLAYELATPFDIDLTPEVISAIVGTNNIYSDTNGDTTVKFKDSIQHYIDNH